MVKEIETLPIYVVVTEQVHIFPWSGNYLLKFIKQVIQCDIGDLDTIYSTVLKPMYDAGQRIQYDIYLREPPTPFRNWKEVELQQWKEAQMRDEQDRIDYLERTAPLEDKPGALPGD